MTINSKILIVDDEPDVEVLIRQKFKKRIQNGELEFMFAENGEAAIALLENELGIDLLFTDINMPKMDGLTLLNEIKKRNILLKSVVVSAYGDIDNIRTAMNRGAFDFVLKPINLVDFELTLNKTLDEAKRHKEALSLKNLLEKERNEKEQLILNQNKMLEDQVHERTRELELEKQKSEKLLLNILPEDIAEELKSNGRAEAREYENVSVLFSDFVNFTKISEELSAKDLVAEIDFLFRNFDEITERCELEKIKTVGDAYIAVCGLPARHEKHAHRVVEAAIEIKTFIEKYVDKRRSKNQPFLEIRIGIHSGNLVAGIVGAKKFVFDIWGDTVNTAARMEQNSMPGKINISGITYELVRDRFNAVYRGKIPAKNKGEIDMYFIEI